MIVEFLGRSDVTVKPVISAYFPLPAPRAKSEISKNYELELLGMDTTRHWEEALKQYVTQCWK